MSGVIDERDLEYCAARYLAQSFAGFISYERCPEHIAKMIQDRVESALHGAYRHGLIMGSIRPEWAEELQRRASEDRPAPPVRFECSADDDDEEGDE